MKEWYMLKRDEDAHWYLIRQEEEAEFNQLLYSGHQDDEDEFIRKFDKSRINGYSSIIFQNPQPATLV